MREARKLGYACRSAFKLVQIDNKFNIFSREHTKCIVDMGSNPGSWIQVAASRSHPQSFLLGVDRKISTSVLSIDLGIRAVQAGSKAHQLERIPSQHKSQYIDGDISDQVTQGRLKSIIDSMNIRADVVQADISPDRSGDKVRDYSEAIRLNSDIAYFITREGLLARGGHFVCKVLGGDEYTRLLMNFCRRNFETACFYKPDACRSSSSEQYLVARFYGRAFTARDDKRSSGVRGNRMERFGIDSWPGLTSRRRSGR